MSAPSLKILLVEDDELFRLGLRVRLEKEDGFEVVAEAEDGETAIELAKRYTLNIVVLDIGLPGIGGIETCRQLRQLYPTLPILVLTSHREKAPINRMIEVGAQGYCIKGAPSEILLLAIRSVAAGASWWDSVATTEIRAAFGNPSPAANSKTASCAPNDTREGTGNYRTASPLTRREQEILALVAAGRTNQEIAEILYITPGTVRVHVHAILQKLDVRDRTQAAILAIQRKLIAEDLLVDSTDF